jgi:hypothetical protein
MDAEDNKIDELIYDEKKITRDVVLWWPIQARLLAAELNKAATTAERMFATGCVTGTGRDKYGARTIGPDRWEIVSSLERLMPLLSRWTFVLREEFFEMAITPRPESGERTARAKKAAAASAKVRAKKGKKKG